jgi:hypothetical protein
VSRRLQAAWLAVTATLFVGWVGYLGWLVLTETALGHKPVVVSRVQLLAADALVVADLTAGGGGGPAAGATVSEVLRGPAELKKAISPDGLTRAVGFTGAGSYLVPLAGSPGAGWRVAVGAVRYPGGPVPLRPQVYPWTPDVAAQVRPWLAAEPAK